MGSGGFSWFEISFKVLQLIYKYLVVSCSVFNYLVLGCQLHTNELLLRHIFLYVDGATTGPHAFSGSIRKSLATCHLLLIVRKYDIVDGELPMVDVQ